MKRISGVWKKVVVFFGNMNVFRRISDLEDTCSGLYADVLDLEDEAANLRHTIDNILAELDSIREDLRMAEARVAEAVNDCETIREELENEVYERERGDEDNSGELYSVKDELDSAISFAADELLRVEKLVEALQSAVMF